MTLRNPDTTYDKDILGAARTYANACIPVFPLKPGWKSPLFPTAHPEGRGTCRGECGKVGHGFHDATLDHDIIRDWWTQTPGANIGVRPWSHIGVVDIDVAEGKRGRETFHQLWRELGPLSDSGWIVETPTGGRHYWLDLSEGDPTDWLDTTEHHYHARGGLGPGVDIKIGRTGYVAAPPAPDPRGHTGGCTPAAAHYLTACHPKHHQRGGKEFSNQNPLRTNQSNSPQRQDTTPPTSKRR